MPPSSLYILTGIHALGFQSPPTTFYLSLLVSFISYLLHISPFHFQRTCFSVRRIMALVYPIYSLPPSSFPPAVFYHFHSLMTCSLTPLTPACSSIFESQVDWRMVPSVKHHFNVIGLESQYVLQLREKTECKRESEKILPKHIMSIIWFEFRAVLGRYCAMVLFGLILTCSFSTMKPSRHTTL